MVFLLFVTIAMLPDSLIMIDPTIIEDPFHFYEASIKFVSKLNLCFATSIFCTAKWEQAKINVLVPHAHKIIKEVKDDSQLNLHYMLNLHTYNSEASLVCNGENSCNLINIEPERQEHWTIC